SQEKRLPSATSTANGTRNFVEETNHSQYRIAARFCFSASVSKPAIPAKSVDCQRWFAIAVHTAFEPDHIDPKARVRLIVISPAPRMVATPFPLPARLPPLAGPIPPDAPRLVEFARQTGRAVRQSAVLAPHPA